MASLSICVSWAVKPCGDSKVLVKGAGPVIITSKAHPSFNFDTYILSPPVVRTARNVGTVVVVFRQVLLDKPANFRVRLFSIAHARPFKAK